MEKNCSLHPESEGCCGHKPGGPQHGACRDMDSSGCLVEKAMDMWACAGHRAWKEVHVDLLKTKILKLWGPQMEISADAVIEAMGQEWQAVLAQGKAKEDLREKIAKIFADGMM